MIEAEKRKSKQRCRIQLRAFHSQLMAGFLTPPHHWPPLYDNSTADKQQLP